MLQIKTSHLTWGEILTKLRHSHFLIMKHMKSKPAHCYSNNAVIKVKNLAFFLHFFLLQELLQFYTDALNQISIRIRLGPPHHSSFKKKNCIWLFIERCQKSVILFKESFLGKKEHLETNNKVQTWLPISSSLKFKCWDFL